MRTYVLALVLLVVLGSAIGVSASEDNLPAKGTKQLIFGFSGWRLDQYKGGIGLRYYLREKTALRFGLDINWTKGDDTGWDHDVYETEEPRLSTYTSGGSSFSVGAGAMLERHFRSSWSVVPYAGLGVFGWYDKSEGDKTTDKSYCDDIRSSVYESKGYTIEGLLLAGAQWHFAPNMSLGGEYRIKMKYSYTEYERRHTEGDSHSTDYDAYKDYNLTLDSSQLWLAISF